MAQINIIDYNKIVYFDENTGNYKIFDGERWWLSDDKFGTSTKPSNVALVDSAIVDTSVVGEEERPAMQTIWSGTFTPIEETYEGITSYLYTTEEIKNARLLADIPAVSFVYDSVEYETPVGYETDILFKFGGFDGVTEGIPVNFVYVVETEPLQIEIGCSSGGEHTLEVKELGGRTIVPQFSGTVTEDTDTETSTIIPIYYYYNANLFSRLPDTLDITINGTLYENVPSYVDVEYGEATYGGNPSDWHGSNYPFAIIFNVNNSELQVFAEHGGEYTIKIEGDLKDNEAPIVVPGGGEVIDG